LVCAGTSLISVEAINSGQMMLVLWMLLLAMVLMGIRSLASMLIVCCDPSVGYI